MRSFVHLSPALRRRRFPILFAIALVASLGITIRHSAAQAGSQPAPGAVGRPGAPSGSAQRRAPKPPGIKGATYYALERQARRVTTRFKDAVVIAERDGKGTVRARLTDLGGNDLASLTVDDLDGQAQTIDFTSADRRRLRATAAAGVHNTLEWGNRQAYSFWKDLRSGSGAVIDWQNGVGRPHGAPLRDIDGEATLMRTEWGGGLVATVARQSGARPHVGTGRQIQGHAMVARLQREGLDAGTSTWYAEERAFEWSLPGLTEGYLDPSRLEAIGGWQFTPDLEWMNMQIFAFHHFHGLVKERGYVARQNDGLWQKLAAWWSPTVQANEPGCDYLHYFDNTTLRPCCDVHDACYEKFGCGASSWWQWWSSWRCDACNFVAFYCFASGGHLPYHQYPPPDPFGD